MFQKLLLFLWALPLYAAPHSNIDLAHLLTNKANHWADRTTVSFPGTTRFENSTERWTPAAAPSYFASVSPANEKDIVTAVSVID
jgi:hypothetical protein